VCGGGGGGRGYGGAAILVLPPASELWHILQAQPSCGSMYHSLLPGTLLYRTAQSLHSPLGYCIPTYRDRATYLHFPPSPASNSANHHSHLLSFFTALEAASSQFDFLSFFTSRGFLD